MGKQMSLLTDTEILYAMDKKLISISNLNPKNIQSGSIYLTLDDEILVSDPETIDCTSICMESLESTVKYLEEISDRMSISNGYTLAPGRYAIGYSKEIIHLTSSYSGQLYNISNLALMGLNCAINSFINPGYKGHAIIVIHNLGCHNIVLKSGIRICQLAIHCLEKSTLHVFDKQHDRESVLEFIRQLSKEKNSSNSDLENNPISMYLEKKIQEVASKGR